MIKEELIAKLKEIRERQLLKINSGEICGDFDDDHILADELLLKFINDLDVAKAFMDIEKWYS